MTVKLATIEIDANGRPHITADPELVFITLTRRQRAALYALLHQVQPRGHDNKMLVSLIQAICHKENEL